MKSNEEYTEKLLSDVFSAQTTDESSLRLLPYVWYIHGIQCVIALVHVRNWRDAFRMDILKLLMKSSDNI